MAMTEEDSMPAAGLRRHRVVAGASMVVGLVAVVALTGSLQTRGIPVELLGPSCEAQMVAASKALGWGSVAAYKKNLMAEGQPVGCATPSAHPQMVVGAHGAKLALKPHPVQQHSDNIIKWMFGDLFDDHPIKSLHPTALHIAGQPPAVAKQAPAFHGNHVRIHRDDVKIHRDDGSRVHRTAAERLYDEESEERRERREREVLGHNEHKDRESRRESDRDLERREDLERKEREVRKEREQLRQREQDDEEEEEREAQELKKVEARRSQRTSREEHDDAHDTRAPARDLRDAHDMRVHGLPPAKQLEKALTDAGNMWGDEAIPVAAVAPPVSVVQQQQQQVRNPHHDESFEEVRDMADEAKALGYKLVPAGLERKAAKLGYDLVPRAAPAASGAARMHLDGSMREQEGERSDPAHLEVLAERDVEKQLSQLTKTKDAKRLQEQATLEQRLKLEFRAQQDVKKAQLREQAARKRAQEHHAAEQAISKYSSMLTFPDETRKAEMKILKEHMYGESQQNKETSLARKNAGKLARTQLSHYNLLTFDEDESFAESDADLKSSNAILRASPFHPLKLTHTEGSLKASNAQTQPQTQTLQSRRATQLEDRTNSNSNLDLPSALKRATLALAAAENQIAKDHQQLEAARSVHHDSQQLATAPHAVAKWRTHQERGATVTPRKGAETRQEVRRGDRAPARRGAGGGVEEEAAAGGKSMLSWNGKGIPRF